MFLKYTPYKFSNPCFEPRVHFVWVKNFCSYKHVLKTCLDPRLDTFFLFCQ